MTKPQKNVLRKLIRELLIARDGEQCLRCAGTSGLSASHIFPKGTHRKLEFDPDNIILLCFRCHICWWHKNPIDAADWIKTAIPKERYKRIELRRQVVDKSVMDFELYKLWLKKEIKTYEKRSKYSS